MDEARRDKLIRGFLDRNSFPVLSAKGRQSGGGTQNPNQGFYDMACPEHGIDEFHVWWFMFAKQVYRLKHWVFARGKTAETLIEMLTDVVNYSLILYTLLVEKGIIVDPDEEAAK